MTDKQLKSNINAFNAKFRDVSHCTVNSKRFIFVSSNVLYSSHPRLNLLSIHPIPFRSPIRNMAMGEDHIVVVDIEGNVYCAESGYHFKFVSSLIFMVSSIPFKRPIVQVSCGSHHTLVLDDEGHVFGFGQNSSGQIPDTDKPIVAEPVMLAIPRAYQIHCHLNQNCVVCEDGVYYWPFYRQNHDEKGKCISHPTKVNTLCYVSLDIVQILCIDGFDVILTNSGQVFAFHYFTDSTCSHSANVKSIFPSSVLPGCIYSLLNGIRIVQIELFQSVCIAQSENGLR